MNLKGVSVCLLASISLFMFGCSQSKNIEKGYDKSKSEIEDFNQGKQDMQENSVADLEKRLYEASYSSEINPKELTMEESLEYVKGVLPSGIQEINKVFESEVGVTSIIYEVDGFKFEVRYMHPYKEDGNMVDEYDLNKTVGISFKVK